MVLLHSQGSIESKVSTGLPVLTLRFRDFLLGLMARDPNNPQVIGQNCVTNCVSPVAQLQARSFRNNFMNIATLNSVHIPLPVLSIKIG